MCHFSYLGNASDWSCPKGNLLQPIKSTTSVWNFCTHFSDVIFWGNQCWRRKMLAFSLAVKSLLNSKTVRIFVYSSKREQSNKRSGMSRVRLARFTHVILLRHALPISLLILRKKPTVLQSESQCPHNLELSVL